MITRTDSSSSTTRYVFSAAPWRRLHAGPRPFPRERRVQGGGQEDGERRLPRAGSGGIGDEAAVGFDDGARRRKPQARAAADFLRGEEGVENAVPHFMGNAGSVVAHVDPDIVSGEGIGMGGGAPKAGPRTGAGDQAPVLPPAGMASRALTRRLSRTTSAELGRIAQDRRDVFGNRSTMTRIDLGEGHHPRKSSISAKRAFRPHGQSAAPQLPARKEQNLADQTPRRVARFPERVEQPERARDR